MRQQLTDLLDYGKGLNCFTIREDSCEGLILRGIVLFSEPLEEKSLEEPFLSFFLSPCVNFVSSFKNLKP